MKFLCQWIGEWGCKCVLRMRSRNRSYARRASWWREKRRRYSGWFRCTWATGRWSSQDWRRPALLQTWCVVAGQTSLCVMKSTYSCVGRRPAIHSRQLRLEFTLCLLSGYCCVVSLCNGGECGYWLSSSFHLIQERWLHLFVHVARKR